jgi:acetylornithine deacetylase/succinyl-diaminopimelate desuccinylase-like protein
MAVNPFQFMIVGSRHAGGDRATEYLRRNQVRFVDELKEFINFASVSAQPARKGDVASCAEWLAARLRRIGLHEVKVISTPGHPIVCAEWMGAPESPTLLVYGHYDVQPAEPLDQWRTPPFKATINGCEMQGRGASDNKGQMWAHIKAIETLFATSGRLPVNIKCLFEGEEEIGSPNLKPFIERHGRRLAADVAVISDTRMLAIDQPTLTYSLRGGISLELEVRGQKAELHSGNFGGAIRNPLQVLCEIIAGLHDQDGRITIPGFYDQVRRISRTEREFLAANGPTNRQILQDAGALIGWGEAGYSLYERTTIRPALSITGIGGGYQGDGVKSIIPAKANARLNFRLVPDQEPAEIERLFRRYIACVTPRSISHSIHLHLAARPAIIDRHHPAMEAAAVSYEKGFGVSPIFIRSGGTIPVVSSLQGLLGIPVVLMGFGLPDDRIHAPNEQFHLPNLFKGIRTSMVFLNEIHVRRGELRK